MKSNLRTYRVAGFYFSVENMPFELNNMQPFLVQDCDGEIIFTLKVVDRLPEEEGENIYKTIEKPGLPVFNVFKVSSGHLFEYQPLPGKPIAGRMLVADDFRSASLVLTGSADQFGLNNSLMLLFSFATACRGALEMHSSVVTKDGRGYLFLGKSGTGKSTHSQLWLNNIPGTELLNDDNPILRLMPDGTVRVYGSPWSGKTPCYKSKDAEVGAIVQLKQAPYNKIERMSVIQSYISLMESASSFRPFKALADGWHKTMEGVCGTTAFYLLECLPDRDAALLCYKTTANGKQDPA